MVASVLQLQLLLVSLCISLLLLLIKLISFRLIQSRQDARFSLLRRHGIRGHPRPRFHHRLVVLGRTFVRDHGETRIPIQRTAGLDHAIPADVVHLQRPSFLYTDDIFQFLQE